MMSMIGLLHDGKYSVNNKDKIILTEVFSSRDVIRIAVVG